MNGNPIFSMMIVLAISLGANAAPIDFNRDVRPILSDSCFQCHGPDKHSRQAALRLDQPGGDQGAHSDRNDIQAVSPGSLEESEVWRRITSSDDGELMPPSDSHKKPLTAPEKAIIREWILQGGKYDKIWAFKPPTIIEPKYAGDWGNGPIDRYVAAQFHAKGLRPNPEAEKRTLLRRLTLDLTGLPPTLEELASFDNDTSASDYEKRVDALLNRPQYGEHMARYWADLVRLADTNGLHTDRPRDFSPYRDWVIRAFNSNMPFDEFVRDQLAGDLNDSPTVDQQVASGFNRLNLMFERGSVLPEESLHRNVLDRVEAFGTAFLGLTVQCAQCHDHKYDPISQKEFYQLYAFFNNCSAEPQTGPAEPGGIQEPSIQVASVETMAQLAELDRQLRKLKAKLSSPPKTTTSPQTLASVVQYWPFDDGQGNTAANKIRTGNAGTLAGSPQWAAVGVNSSTALNLEASKSAHVDGGNINLTSTSSGGEVTISMWLFPDGLFSDNRIIGQTSGDTSQAGSVRVLANGAMEIWSGSTWLQVAPAGGLSTGFWQHLALVWKGKSVTAFFNGAAQQTVAAGFHFGTKHGNFGIGARFLKLHGATFDGKIDEVAVFNSALSKAEISSLAGAQFENNRGLRKKVSELTKSKQQMLSEMGRRAMVMREREPRRKANVRIRGNYDKLGEEVQRGTPNFLPPLESSDTVPSRIDLARWLLSPEHPLTARVTANRFWQQLFGVGLVKTSEDFGAQGQSPSHPGLLDYLAVRFVESDWDVKRLMREIVLSETYRQQSNASPEAYRTDAENRMLARGSRYRMDAEMIRDQLLMVSGKLNSQMYGMSVKPPQPLGLWKSVTMTNEVFQADRGPAIYRRSLYTYWKRVMSPPQMTILNAPSREYCVARRERTNTPLQALVLMNEPEYFKLALACAQRTLDEVRNDRTKALPRLYERITSHKPTTAELKILEQALDDFIRHYANQPNLTKKIAPEADTNTAAWAMLAHSLLNLETVRVKR